MKDKNHLITFITISFSLSILLSVFIGFTGGHESKFIWMGFSSMLIPAITVLTMNYVFKAPVNWVNRNKFSIIWLPLALFLMPALIHSVCLPLLAFLNNNSLPWQSWLTTNKDGLYYSPGDRDWGALTLNELVFRIFINAITGLIIVSALAFFEEIGWRAWMLPRLIKRFNVKKGVCIGALIWALWHIPFILSGILYIKGVPLYSILLLNPIGIFGAGIIISWFWLKTKSIWIVSLAHGALNDWGQYAFKYIQDSPKGFPGSTWLLVGLDGSLFIPGIIILITMKNNHFINETGHQQEVQ